MSTLLAVVWTAIINVVKFAQSALGPGLPFEKFCRMSSIRGPGRATAFRIQSAQTGQAATDPFADIHFSE